MSRRRRTAGIPADLSPLRQVAVVFPGWDPYEVRLFEPVVATIENVVSGVEVLRPGVCLFPAAGAARFWGGEEALVAALTESLAECAESAVRIGIAEGAFAAWLAARQQRIIPPGKTSAFLSLRDIGELPGPELATTLRRCGITTLGHLAQLPKVQTESRFGPEGTKAWHLASGHDLARPAPSGPAPVVEAEAEPEDPIDTTQQVIVWAEHVAKSLCHQLTAHHRVCTVLRITATSTEGQQTSRVWRADNEVFSPANIAMRTRWQLDAWLTSPSQPTGPITAIVLRAEQTASPSVGQLGLWGDDGDTSNKLTQRIDGIQDRHGVHTVHTAHLTPGRIPSAQIQMIPWREKPPASQTICTSRPGRIPAPYTTFVPPQPVTVSDADGQLVAVNDRQLLSASPACLSYSSGWALKVIAFAGPWPLHEQWWNEDTVHEGAWLQLVVQREDLDTALLTYFDMSRWWLVGSYA